MASETDILETYLVIASAKEQKNASKNAPKKAKMSQHDRGEKENEKVGMTRGGHYQKCLLKGI
jgi:hypothetical protein